MLIVGVSPVSQLANIQGRYNIICPVQSAWDLHRALPESEPVIVPDGTHSPLDPGMVHELVKAAEDFKDRN